jgi:tRNA-dihydrouridine synthase C
MLFLPGPMEGVMSADLVRAANRLALFDEWITPFCRLSSGVPHTGILRKFLAPFAAAGRPVTVQLMGVDAKLLAAGARAFAELGATGINLNFCCPSRQVCSGGAGGAMLKTPEKMTEILRAVKTAVPELPVGAKIRCGWADPAELDAIIPALRRAGELSMLIVHHRAVLDRYLPVPDRRARFARVTALAGDALPVVVNGDLIAPEELRREAAAAGAAGAMAARGILRDPWLLRRAAGEPAPEPEAGRTAFFAAVLDEAGASGGMRPGAAIELSNFIWGRENRYFEALKKQKSPVTPDFLSSFGT